MHNLVEWKTTKLKDVAKIRGNKRVKGISRVALIPMELIPDSGIFAEYRVVPIEQVKSSTYCEAGDILLAKITPSLENGKQGIVPFDVPNGFALATTEVFPIAPEEDKIDRFFLFYLLKFGKFRQKIIASMTGTTGRQRASKKAVENLLIPLPPLPEQKKIAEILRTVDEAIEKTDGAIERTERLKKGLMRRLLTRGIGHERFKKTELGEIPEEWRVVRLGDATKVVVGYVGAINKFYTSPVQGVPLLSTANITKHGIRLETVKYVTKEFHDKNRKSQVFPGDLIVARHGESGTAAVIPPTIPEAHALNVVIVRRSQNFDSKFLEYFFNFDKTRARLIGWKAGSVQGVVNTKVLEKFKIPLPPLEEQKQIVEILSTVDRKLELLRQRREKLERVKRGLMNDLLTGRRRVKV